MIEPEPRANGTTDPPAPSPEPKSARLTVTTPVDWRVVILMFGALYFVYLFSASLLYLSTDELTLYDTTESFARRASVFLSETADFNWPGETRDEPGQPFLAVPLFWLADQFSSIGNLHTTWLFNLIVTAFTGSLLMLYVLRLGYSRRVALTVAALFGLTTIAWPYSQSFFREPLSGLLVLLAGYGLLRWRQAMQTDSEYALPFRWLLLAVAATVGALLTKEATVLALPFLALPLVSKRLWTNMRPRTLLILGGLTLLVVIGLASGMYYYTVVLDAGASRWDFAGRIEYALNNLGWVQYVANGFVLSPGKGLFWHSPILFLALLMPFAADRERRFDTLWPLLATVVFIVAYALTSTHIWFGGANWGARYLVPLTPLLMLSATPMIARAFEPGRWASRVAVFALGVAGLLVQVGAVAVHPLTYYDLVARTLPEGAPWNELIWELQHSAILGHWRLMLEGQLGFAWFTAFEQPDFLLGGILALAAAFGLVALGWGHHRREGGWVSVLITSVVLWATIIGVTSAMLIRIYPDIRYQGNNPALHALRTELENTNLPDPVIFLNNRTYFNFMLNYYKGSAKWYTLPLNTQESLTPGLEPPHPRSDPQEFVNYDVWNYLNYFGRQHQMLLLVMETGPFDPGILRPTEWLLNDTFYKMGEQEFDPRIRLIRYSTATAPTREDTPQVSVNLKVGDTMRVVGYSADPSSRVVRPGSLINVTVWWEALAEPGADFSIGTYLITPQGTLAQQYDSYPVGGFYPTATWRTGDIIRHNSAFYIPPDAPPGFYEVWTVMYNPFTLERLEVTDATGTSVRDHIVLFSIEVTR